MLAPSSLLSSTDPRTHDGASSDQLARAFLQQLAQDERKRLKADQRSNPFGFGDDPLLDENDAIEQIVIQDEENRPEATHVPVPADLAAVAVMLARAIEAEPGLVRRLRREAPVVTLATHVIDLVEPVRIVAEKCLFRPDTKVCSSATGSAETLGPRRATT